MSLNKYPSSDLREKVADLILMRYHGTPTTNMDVLHYILDDSKSMAMIIGMAAAGISRGAILSDDLLNASFALGRNMELAMLVMADFDRQQPSESESESTHKDGP
jgi:hypothetical protein